MNGVICFRVAHGRTRNIAKHSEEENRNIAKTSCCNTILSLILRGQHRTRMGNFCSTCGITRAAINTANTVIEDGSSIEATSSREASSIVTGPSGSSVPSNPCPKAAPGTLRLPIPRRIHPSEYNYGTR